MSDKPELKTIESHCNKCGPDITHNILSSFEKKWEETIHHHGNSFDVNGAVTYLVLECAGCKEIHTRKDSWDSEGVDYENETYEITYEYNPPRIFRKKSEWMERDEFKIACPAQIQALFDEAYICMQNECPRSTAMAIRATLEEIMIQKIVIDQGNFPSNLNAFMAYGFLSTRNLTILKTVLETGHSSIHRAFEPAQDDLILCLDIAEQIAQMIYVHDEQAKKLKDRLPPRNGMKSKK